MAFPKSKTGWIFAVVYLGVATYLYFKTFTSKVFLGDLIGFWPSLPFGIIYYFVLKWLNQIFYFSGAGFDGTGYPPIISMPFTHWLFVIPTITVNAIIYYWLGIGVSKSYKRFFGKNS